MGSQAVDLGQAALLPGLVNAHCHLDYTVMRGYLEDLPFLEWVRALNGLRPLLDYQDWLASAALGAGEAVASGITTIGDCSPTGAALEAAMRVGLRGVVYQEVFGIEAEPSTPDIVADARTALAALRRRAEGSRIRCGISPHSLYTVRPDLFAAVMALAEEVDAPVCIHAAESRAEDELTRAGAGDIAAMFRRRQIRWQTPGCSPIAYLERMGALKPRTLLVHGVNVGPGDGPALQSAGVAWAHCPKSNAKLGNGIAALDLLTGSGGIGASRVGIGSDSVASNNTMDLFEEMRFAVLVQRARSWSVAVMTARDALAMATIGGARALRMDAEVGSLEPGKQADLVGVRLDTDHVAPAYDPCSALVYSASGRDVVYTMIGGQPVYEFGEHRTIDMRQVRSAFRAASAKLQEVRA